MKSRCKYCMKPISPQGMPAHIHFRHRAYVSRELSLNPIVQLMQLALDGYMPRFAQKQLPSPCPLTVYSSRPLGYMAVPIPELRRPKGYELPQNYARPSDLLMAHHNAWWMKGLK